MWPSSSGSAAVQSALAAAVLRRPSGRWLAAIAVVNGGVVAVWVVSRTAGLPVDGATAAESIGFKDGICTLLEVGICAGAGLLGALPEAARRAALADRAPGFHRVRRPRLGSRGVRAAGEAQS